MRHALEQERERREVERLRVQREHAASLQLAKQNAEAEDARHHRLAQQQHEEEARAMEEAAAAIARVQAEEAAVCSNCSIFCSMALLSQAECGHGRRRLKLKEPASDSKSPNSKL